ncbi:TIGR02808 family protein [Moritella marina ATCC 15381]|uniref:TIGR02808 family protein n=1 Tax=Moritella marina ATCC 15381 TaxID=1202962 RepID=A0A5J6WI32_MORMI|nr:TIGR02808 family protein [Moritella marina]QFI37716.1 TIGR02808 family protein [Moritella marina ATCC 15381]
MSTLEYVIWHILGYAAIPTILLAGFVAVAGVSVFALSFTADKNKA